MPLPVFRIPHSNFRILVALFLLINQPIQPNNLKKLNQLQLKPRRRPPFAEGCFAGGIFCDVLFELFAPQGLKCPATAVQRIEFGEIGKFAQQITKGNFTGGHTCVFRHHTHTESGI